MSAIFNVRAIPLSKRGSPFSSLTHVRLLQFKSVIVVVLLFICTSTFVRQQRPSMFREKKPGLLGLVYKGSVIGTRLSPYVSLCCFIMAGAVLFF